MLRYRPLRWIVALPVLLLYLYGAAGMVGGLVPVNAGWRAADRGVRIYVEDNGIHTGIVLPAEGWDDIVRPNHFRDPRYANHRWRSFGWGDRAFYVETPTWADLRPMTVLRAAIGSDRTVMHVDAVPEPRVGGHIRAIVLRPEEYARLRAFIRASFAPGASLYGYGDYDVFYPATGGYSAIRTCNAWTGDGRPVMVLPGLFNADRSNVALRGFLNRIGYRAHGWGLGRNFGTRTIGADAERLVERIEDIAESAGQPVTLIGVSLGGIMARLIAHRRPDLVCEVVTISSPYAGHPRSTRVWRAFELITGERVDDARVAELRAEIVAPLSVPATAIWSASDGLVNGLACRGGDCAAIEVVSGHLGVQLQPEVLLAVARVLARSEMT